MQDAVSILDGERISHWEMNGAIYHVVLHLANSVPAAQLAEWRETRQHYISLRDTRKDGLSDDEIAAPAAGLTIKDIVDRWKSITTHAIAKLSGMSAPIWQRDHYSRIIRTPEEYRRQVSYVWHNPESAGLTTGFLRKRY